MLRFATRRHLIVIACAACMSACTSTQVVNSAQFAGAAVMGLGIGVLKFKNDRDKRRNGYTLGRPACTGPCEWRRELAIEQRLEEIERRERRRESEEFRQQFDDFIEQLETTEQVSIDEMTPLTPDD